MSLLSIFKAENLRNVRTFPLGRTISYDSDDFSYLISARVFGRHPKDEKVRIKSGRSLNSTIRQIRQIWSGLESRKGTQPPLSPAAKNASDSPKTACNYPARVVLTFRKLFNSLYVIALELLIFNGTLTLWTENKPSFPYSERPANQPATRAC